MKEIEQYIRDIDNFPKQGIVFKDITPLLASSTGMKLCKDALLESVKNLKIDKVVGIESRGFFFATLLSQELNAGFVPVRKPGKLPFKTISKSYALEYGTDSLEMHVDAIQPGDRVLLHDDVLATGGTAAAVVELIEKLGGIVVQCNFIMELTFLEGRNKLEGKPISAVLSY